MACMTVRAWLLAALLGASATPAWGWGPLGHRTIGAIADRLLSAQARAAVVRLLNHDPDATAAQAGRDPLEAVSTWADDIRGTPASRPSWHFDNIPACGAPSLSRHCPGGRCATVELERLIGVLRDPRAPPARRAVALKWVVHLVGDIHQPLHAADNADRGGNAVRVRLAGRRSWPRLTLHEAWDSTLVELALHTRNRRRPPHDIDALARRAERLLRARGQGTPISWARESNRLARTVAYRYPGFLCGRRPHRVVVLDSAYQRAAERVIREQLLLAGARLAALLDRILAPAPTAGLAPAPRTHGA